MVSNERDGSIKESTVTLKYPFKFGETEVTQFTFRRPKAKDLKDIPSENQKFGDILKVMAKLANEPPAKMDEMDAADLTACAEVITSFLGNSRKTGDNP